MTWTSSNESIVTVDAKGRITAHHTGEAVIKVKTKAKGDDKKYRTASRSVKVKPRFASQLAVTPASVSLSANSTQQLSFTVKPSNVTQIVPVYKSSNSKIAFVSESGLVTGLRKGSATISVKVGGTAALAPSVYTMVSGKKSTEKVSQRISYRSSNPQVATVSEKGVILATGTGVCEITVRSDVGNYEMSCVVTVFDHRQVMRNDKAALSPGAKKDLKAELFGIVKDNIERDWMWGSSVPGVAEVSQGGIVTAKKPGKTTIVAYTPWGDSVTFEVEVA